MSDGIVSRLNPRQKTLRNITNVGVLTTAENRMVCTRENLVRTIQCLD